MTVPVTVNVASYVPSEGVDRILEDLRAIGLDPTPKVVPTRRGFSDLPWLLLLLPMKLFFETLVQELAGDAYSRLNALVSKAFQRSRALEDAGDVLILKDTDTNVHVVLEPDLPPEAYRQLFQVDLSNVVREPLRYDHSRHEWR